MKRTALGLKAIFFPVLALLAALATSCGTSNGDEAGVARTTQSLCSTVVTTGSPGGASVGDPITLTSVAGGCGVPEFEIYRYGADLIWHPVSAYSTTNDVYVWDSTGAPGGWQQFAILARPQGSVQPYENIYYLDYYLRSSPALATCTGVSTSASPTSTSVGNQVTLTSSATGCSTPEYQIRHRRPDGTWVLDSAFSTANSSYSWNSTGETAGWNQFEVLARAQGSTNVVEASYYFDYYLTPLVVSACNTLTTTPSPASGAGAKGNPITLTSVAGGCSTPEYEIYYYSGGWQVLSAYSTTNNSYIWDSSAATPGWQTFLVLARAQGSGRSYDVYKYVEYYLKAATVPACTGLSTVAAPSGATVGAQVTLTNTATGCATPEYQIRHRRPDGNWYLDSAYSTANGTFVWDTSAETAGWQQFEIFARAQGSAAAAESVRYLDYYLQPFTTCSTAGFSFTPPTNTTVGTSVTLSASSTGCTYPTYLYRYQAPGSSTWVTLQDWTTAPTAIWNTNLAAPGSYNFEVLVRAAGSSAPSEAVATGTYTLDPSSTPTVAQGIGGGFWEFCVLTGAGNVGCWGMNAKGELGRGSTDFKSPTPAAVTGISQAISLGVGYEHACVSLLDGTVRCWGWNHVGQLGNGSSTDSNVPVTVTGVTNVSRVAAGIAHTCALLANGTLKCWGYNSQGQLGNGTKTAQPGPVTVAGISTATQLSLGYYHTCALLADGTVRCWGLNSSGQLGNGTTTTSLSPVTVTGLSGVVSLSSAYHQNCAVKSDGTVWCWGSNSDYSTFGNGSTTMQSAPAQVTGITTATGVAVNAYHACASLQGGTATCWGLNNYGQVGNGTTVDSPVPVAVSNLTTVVSVATTINTSCATLADGTAACWGSGLEGSLGTGGYGVSSVPVAVGALP